MRCVVAKVAIVFAVGSVIAGCARKDLFRTSALSDGESGILAPYSLPEGLVTFVLERESDGGELKLEILPVEYRPDPDHHYVLRYRHSNFSNDEVSVELDSFGFLKTICTRTRDETGTVALQIVQLAAEAAKAVAGRDPDKRPPLPKFRFRRSFDPTDREEIDDFTAYLRQNWDADLDINPRLLTGRGGIAGGPMAKCTTGACFRPALPYEITFNFSNIVDSGAVIKKSEKFLVALPNDAPILAIELERYAFVDAITKIDFENGMLTKFHLSKPSEAVGLMDVPIDMAKAVASIPSALFDFKINAQDRDQRLAEKERLVVAAQTDLLERQAALFRAQVEALEAERAALAASGKRD